MDNLAEVFLVGLGVRKNYIQCLVKIIIYMELGGVKRYGGDFKVIILKMGPVFRKVIDLSIHHEGGSPYAILLF